MTFDDLKEILLDLEEELFAHQITMEQNKHYFNSVMEYASDTLEAEITDYLLRMETNRRYLN